MPMKFERHTEVGSLTARYNGEAQHSLFAKVVLLAVPTSSVWGAVLQLRKVCQMRFNSSSILLVVFVLVGVQTRAQTARDSKASDKLDIPAISRLARGAVVSIIVSDKNDRPISQGSGFFIRRGGELVTNYH